MKLSRKLQQILKRITTIERMERGKICQMPGRPHYNHQTWHEGKNVVRYVPASEVESLQEAIDGYQLFCRLAEQYADEIIRRTRNERDKIPPSLARKPKKSKMD